MASLLHLPTPKNNLDDPEESTRETVEKSLTDLRKPRKGKVIPSYPNRKRSGFVPRSKDDFADGGAYPEIHVAQYPLDMGRKDKAATSTTVAVRMDAEGKVRHDAILNQGGTKNKHVHSQYTDLIERQDVGDLSRPDEEEVQKVTEKTKAALEKVVEGKIKAAKPNTVAKETGQQKGPTYVRYTPGQQGGAFNSGAQQRVIRIVEAPTDPMEPPKFKAKRIPTGPPSPPVPVMHSPPRKVTVKDQQNWKIPPCISSWKNPKGYTIALDKRLASDGRGLQDVQINDNFAKLSESLYIAERNAREEVEKRAAVAKAAAVREREEKERELREIAIKAREERAGVAADDSGSGSDNEDAAAREDLRRERKRERERNRRIEMANPEKRTKLQRERDRDVSEKIALGLQAAQKSEETMYDARLFNQSQGMDSGFGAEDSYNVYDKKLFTGGSSHLSYRPKAEGASYGTQEDLDKLKNTEKFKPDRGFEGTDKGPQRDKDAPVQFEKDEDVFEIDKLMSEAKKKAQANKN